MCTKSTASGLCGFAKAVWRRRRLICFADRRVFEAVPCRGVSAVVPFLLLTTTFFTFFMSAGLPPGAAMRHVPSYSHDESTEYNALMPRKTPSPSSSEDAGPSAPYRAHAGRTGSASGSEPPLSWVDPFDPNTLFDPPTPVRPFSDNYNRGHTPTGSVAGRDSVVSLVESQRGLLSAHNRNSSTLSMGGYTPGDRASSSLSLNYVPTKFSDVLAHGGARRRKRARDGDIRAPVMARGGGVDAFRSGEARMADDRDDLEPYQGRKGWLDRSDPDSRWTRFKWVLLIFNTVYTGLALGALVICMLIWFDYIASSDVLRVANRTALIFSTLAASVALFASVFGWAGVMLNNRCTSSAVIFITLAANAESNAAFLAFYNLFLWFSFGFLVVPGYLTYRRWNLNLEGKINFEWSQLFDIDARRRIQNALHCCGYFSPFVEASISSTCYARSILPGCKAPYLSFQRHALQRWYITVFSIAAFHILVIVAALLCSNHVTYRFGKGMMPKRYRLDAAAVAIIVEEYGKQLKEQFGDEVARRAVAGAHSRNASVVDLRGSFAGLGAHSRDASAAELNLRASLGGHGRRGSSAVDMRTSSSADPRLEGRMSAMEMHARDVSAQPPARGMFGFGGGAKYGTIGGTMPDTAI
ncbi:Tetraspanin Tsp2 [Mycena kentingensis (nom. inval.)]|nr:Tetraspanin Tsp2 [Mycena kentingensis (nom. inval.)]